MMRIRGRGEQMIDVVEEPWLEDHRTVMGVKISTISYFHPTMMIDVGTALPQTIHFQRNEEKFEIECQGV